LSFLHNYFDGPAKFSDLYLAKFLDISAKSFLPCRSDKREEYQCVELSCISSRNLKTLYTNGIRVEIQR